MGTEERASIGTEEELYGSMVRGLALTVNAKDPLKGVVNYKNNTIEPGTEILIGYIFGIYDPAKKEFGAYAFNYGGVIYALGTVRGLTMGAKGSTGAGSIYTYAIVIAANIDIFAFMGIGTLNTLPIDFTSGSRIIGLKAEDVNNLSWLALRVYEDQLTVTG